MNKSQLLTKTIFKSIWMAAAVIWLILGGLTFMSYYNKGNGFVGWLCWGFGAAILTLSITLKAVAKSGSDGAKDGANHYTYSNGRISNHPFLGALFGVIAGIFFALLFGPIVLIIRIIAQLPGYIQLIKELRYVNSLESEE